MRIPRPHDALEFLQWFGVFGAALTWAAQHVVGFGVAHCGNAGRFNFDYTIWEIVLTALAAALAALSWGAALRTFLALRGHEHFDDPPAGRRYFFAVATLIGDVLLRDHPAERHLDHLLELVHAGMRCRRSRVAAMVGALFHGS
jgi:hypothetical protein